MKVITFKGGRWESNPRMSVPQTDVLTTSPLPPLSSSRGRGNRTPTNGFGDRRSTVKLYPYFGCKCYSLPMARDGIEPPTLRASITVTTGFEPVIFRVTGERPNQLDHATNGRYRDRTCDPLLVRQVLSQLS